MDDIRLRYYNPIIGTPTVTNTDKKVSNQTNVGDFGNILKEKIDNTNDGVVFSKHANKRVSERNMEISKEDIERLNQGVKMANAKNINDALILIDQKAFVVNIPTNTVITTKNNDEIQGDVFTNINGTVII